MYSVSRTCWTLCRPSWVSRRCPTSPWWWSTSRASSGTSSPSSTLVIPSPRWVAGSPFLYFIEMCYTETELWAGSILYDLWAVVNPEIPGCSVERFRHSAGTSGLLYLRIGEVRCGLSWKMKPYAILCISCFLFLWSAFSIIWGKYFLSCIYFFLQINGLVLTSMLTANVCLLINAVLIGWEYFFGAERDLVFQRCERGKL